MNFQRIFRGMYIWGIQFVNLIEMNYYIMNIITFYRDYFISKRIRNKPPEISFIENFISFLLH